MAETVDSYWSKLYRSGKDYRPISDGAIAKFLAFTSDIKSKTCLDIGCGTGQLARKLCNCGYRALGIDASTEAINIARASSAAPSDALNYLRFNIEHDDLHLLPSSIYSLITCKLMYAFIDDKPKFLGRVQTLLRSSGYFVVITPLPADVPPEKRDVAVSEDELALLSHYFQQTALYKDDGLTYFVGKNTKSS